MQVDRRPRVLVLSRNYPNDVQKLLGMWVRQTVAASSAEICDPKVIAPVPWCPPLPGIPENYVRFRRIARHPVTFDICWKRVVDSHGWMLFRRC